MKITIVGCGNAFSAKSYNQSMLLEENGRKLLIDAGYQVPEALREAGIDFRDIDDIYISHLHADHVGGLEYFAFQRYDWINKHRDAKGKGYAPRLIANKQLLQDLWNKSLRGGLESMEGFVSNINTFFETMPIEPNEPFEWQGWRVDLVQQIHVMSGSVIMPSFGMIFSKPGHQTVYFVTDSQHCSPRQIEDFYKKADIIFQDSEFVGLDTHFEEGETYFINKDNEALPAPQDDMKLLEYQAQYESQTWSRYKFGSGVHANYAQLAGYPSANSIKLSNEIKSKMWLSHYQDFVLAGKDMYGNEINWDEQVAQDGFAGLLKVGQKFEV